MGKLEAALAAPTDGDKMSWLWQLAAAVERPPKKLPEGFEDAAIGGLARAATAMGEPKQNSWGIGFSRVAEVGAKFLAACPTERLAKVVLGLAALSGIGGDVVTSVRRRKANKGIAKALTEYDRREAKAGSYAAMRKAMKGYVDEAFLAKDAKAKAKKPPPPGPSLHIVNGRLIPNGQKPKKGKDERTLLAPTELTKKERAQLVGVLAKAFGIEKTFPYEEIFSGESKRDELQTTAETPIEWWDVVDDKKKVHYQLFTYHADCGSLVEAGTDKRLASIIQFGFEVEVKDPDRALKRRMGRAHAEFRKRCPKSYLAMMNFSDDD
jgi:hypothetical protein